MSNSNTPGNFPESTPSEAGGTPAQLQTPLPNSAFQTPAFGDILSPGDRFTPLPNTIGSGRQYVVPPMRGHTSTSVASSPLYYPGSQNAPVAPRVTNASAVGPDTFEAEEIRTQRRNFHRGDINSTILSPGFETMSPGVGLTPFAQGGPARSQEPSTPFQIGASPGQFGTPGQSSQSDTTQVIWGTTVNIHKAMSDFYKFLSSFSLDDLPETMRDAKQPAEGPYYANVIEEMSQTQQLNLNLDCSHLLAFSETQPLYHQLKRYPQEIIPLMDHTLTTLYFERFGIQDHLTQPLRVRPYNLVESVNMRELNPSDIDQLVTVKGLLIRASHVLPDLKSAFFKCYVCDHTVTVGIDRGVVAEPTVCPRSDCQSANSMQLIHNRSMFADKQVCKLQETPDNIPDGQTPHSVSLCLYDDLVDASKPGDRLEVTGIFRSVPIRVNPRMRTIKSLFRTYVDVVHIKTVSASRTGGVSVEESADPLQDPSQRLSPEQEDEIRALSTSSDIYAKLSHSVAPSIFGLDDVKKGVLLQLFGGSTRVSSSQQATRGDLHILLVGDPGTSKSQLLQYAHRIAPRGMYTSGKGSSAVGLTAYVTRDPDTNQLVLESGALVLSDGGLCCIDEFDKMSDATRSILHEVMEQQTVSIAKAGIITTLNARTSILACANPVESQWQRNLSVPENINLPPSLLSRFDLVYLMLDTANEDQDRRLARHLVSLYLNPNGRVNEANNAIPTQLLTRYISYAKSRINPILNDEASRELVRMYVDLRKAGESNRRQESRITATTRQLESLIRLSEAHARMRLSPVVEKSDVEEAFRLLREAIKESATDPRTGLIDWDILATGLGTHSRRQLVGIKSGLVELLGQPASSANIPIAQLLVELNRRAASSGVSEVTHRDLEIILNELENDQLVTLSGTGRNGRKVRRNFHQGYTLPAQN